MMCDLDIEDNAYRRSGALDEKGSALLLSLLVLAVFTLLGLVMVLNALTGLYISDNYESHIRAECASLSGLNHAHVLMRGLNHDVFLTGPDGSYNPEASYLDSAVRFEFRNPLPIVLAQSLDITDPEKDIAGLQDDGLINTGYYSGLEGIPLIPVSGIAQTFMRPGRNEVMVSSRYFVKVTDNNGEFSEKNGDSSDSPFIDGDGEIIVRSIGVAGTVTDVAPSVTRRNSVVVYEARFRKFSLFDFGPALIILGSRVVSSFEGDYRIGGGPSPGIGIIDVDESDMEQMILAGSFGNGTISGAALPNPSIEDLTQAAVADSFRFRVMDAAYLRDFVIEKAPMFADNYFIGDQSWSSENAPDIGAYDPAKPYTAPGQNPKVTVVHGNLQMTGNLSGAGLLIVTGEFQCLDECRYSGLILVIGTGKTDMDTDGPGITGGLFTASLIDWDEWIEFGSPVFSIRGNSRIMADRDALEMAISLIPRLRTSFREIAGRDP
jgi:hypothetical protein